MTLFMSRLEESVSIRRIRIELGRRFLYREGWEGSILNYMCIVDTETGTIEIRGQGICAKNDSEMSGGIQLNLVLLVFVAVSTQPLLSRASSGEKVSKDLMI